MLDDTWYVDAPLEVAMQRVFARQVALGLDPNASKVRVAANDKPNAMMVQATKGVAKVLVPSDVPF
jgi:pantothenate kinase